MLTGDGFNVCGLSCGVGGAAVARMGCCGALGEHASSRRDASVWYSVRAYVIGYTSAVRVCLWMHATIPTSTVPTLCALWAHMAGIIASLIKIKLS